MTCACCDFEPRPRTTTTVPIGPLAVRPNLEVAAVRLRWVGENDARVTEAGDSDHTRVRMQLHQRAVGREQAEALLGTDEHADERKANAEGKQSKRLRVSKGNADEPSRRARGRQSANVGRKAATRPATGYRVTAGGSSWAAAAARPRAAAGAARRAARRRAARSRTQRRGSTCWATRGSPGWSGWRKAAGFEP